MKTIQLIFSKTFYFWVVIRAIIILLFTASLFTDNHERIQFQTLKAFLVYIPFQLYVVALIILFCQFGLKMKRNLYIQIFAGLYSIYYSLTVSADLYNENPIYLQILPLLLFLFGIWQIFFDKTEEAKDKISEIGRN